MRCSKYSGHSITSSARASSEGGIRCLEIDDQKRTWSVACRFGALEYPVEVGCRALGSARMTSDCALVIDDRIDASSHSFHAGLIELANAATKTCGGREALEQRRID